LSQPLSIGYVGVGLMGLPMTRRLLEKGHAVTAFDIDPARMTQAHEAGATVVASAAAVVGGADLVLLNLPTPYAVEAAVFGDQGVATTMRPPQRLVDFSTIKVAQGKDFAARLQALTGCAWIDAPVSGGPPASASGTLTVMVGGEPSDVEAIGPLLRDVSARFTHMGPTGSGLVAKMINQLIVGNTHAVLAEALGMAEAAGINAALIPQCLAGGHADGTLLQRLYPRMVQRDFAPQGYARQLLKDLEMVDEFGRMLQVRTPMTGEVLALYRKLVHEMGHSELDTCAIYKLYEQGAG
jgi:3-hydroxyisobutyrate dehydrogenase-like beta-hydroxyacid dehydrogenase